MARPDLAVVIPAFNRSATIGSVVAEARQWGAVIVVDDGSSDDTSDRARGAGALVVRNPGNLGYDRTLETGMQAAANAGYRYAVTMDADGEHDPAVLAAFTQRLVDDDCQLVLGVRPRKHRFAEVVMSFYVWLRFGVSDILCGMKGYDLALLRENCGFDHTGSIGTELALNALRRGARFAEVPVLGMRRRDAPRFDRCLRANLRIFLALGSAIAADLRSRTL